MTHRIKELILCYDLYFPLKKVKFNKNIHKIKNFMTKGLLISPENKLTLHKVARCNPSVENIDKYKEIL